MAFRLLIKSGLAYVSVKYTIDQGVWASSARTTQLYNDIGDSLSPHWGEARKKIPLELPLLPSSGEACFVAKYYYNQGIKGTFNFIHRLPCHIGQWTKKAKDTIGGAFSSFEEAPAPGAPAPVKEK
ncbi:MICOS complex subunit MIC13 homolog QIL1-like [Lutzomyia longipalpis]|uniref:MICOS complex subunit MIC13 n=1 Tax=Lutzomyia longipalpis TaxID=7200 RepID=A0A1B0CH57_LUTLO|nr:MICOS complex subunit MIC13 homolog QIL1-like [Lutzomyia longipalpis]